MCDAADVQLARGKGEEIIVTIHTIKGALVAGKLFNEPDIQLGSKVVTEMALFDLLGAFSACLVAMVDDEDPTVIYFIEGDANHLH